MIETLRYKSTGNSMQRPWVMSEITMRIHQWKLPVQLSIVVRCPSWLRNTLLFQSQPWVVAFIYFSFLWNWRMDTFEWERDSQTLRLPNSVSLRALNFSATISGRLSLAHIWDSKFNVESKLNQRGPTRSWSWVRPWECRSLVKCN